MLKEKKGGAFPQFGSRLQDFMKHHGFIVKSYYRENRIKIACPTAFWQKLVQLMGDDFAPSKSSVRMAAGGHRMLEDHVQWFMHHEWGWEPEWTDCLKVRDENGAEKNSSQEDLPTMKEQLRRSQFRKPRGTR